MKRGLRYPVQITFHSCSRNSHETSAQWLYLGNLLARVMIISLRCWTPRKADP